MRRPLLRAAIAVVVGVGVCTAAPAAAQDVGSLLSPGPLSRAHAELEGLKKCDSCHEPGKGVSAARCLKCHEPIATRIAERRGVHRDVTDDCVACHVEHLGRNADIRPLDVDGFDHIAETGFALDGVHAPLADNCDRCHRTRSFLTLQPDCASCHKDNHGGHLGTDCAACHTTAAAFAATGLAFDHTQAAFQLEGSHATVDCAACHKEHRFRDLSFAECSDCHSDPHGAAFGPTCSSCHTPEAWRTSTVDHGRTDFPLRGAHATVPCASCHEQPPTAVQLAFAECRDCHSDPHRGTFSEDCRVCHEETGFAGAAFDHRGRTSFALDGRHGEISCVACHHTDETVAGTAVADLGFRGLEPSCASCHHDAHNGELGVDCASCHAPHSFRLSAFEHPNNVEFFQGRHQTAPCADCHRDLAAAAAAAAPVSSRVYRGLDTECASCHRDVHLGQLGVDCAGCHVVTAAGFAAPGFAHDSTDFKLSGRHAAIECVACHKTESDEFPAGHGEAVRFAGTDTECATCHRDPHLGQFADSCAQCHGTASFAVTDHTHGGDAGFFAGGHAGVACRQCHRTVEADFPAGHGEAALFVGLNRQCSTCHDDAHRGTLGDDCASCHAVDVPFRNPSRAFHKATMLPLEGRHLQVPCADCHWNGQIKGTPTKCYDCHWIRRQDDLFKTRLGNDCETCHQPISWTAVNWDHAAVTGHQLTGAHATLDCESCHSDGRFDGAVATDCVSCHLGDYQEARDPDHVAAGFPTDCELCHSPGDGSWGGGDFNHSTFQLIGGHATLDCSSCHSDGVFQGLPSDCADCHISDYQQTDDPDHVAAGFPTDCEVCHRPADVSWDQGRFDHAIYPLVGAHVAQPCTACHSGGVFEGLPSECVDCHLEDYQQTDDPDHAAAAFPLDCEVCHRAADSDWTQAHFDHATFQLVGTHATLDCDSCHAGGVYEGLPSDCADCHLDEYQQTSEPDHAAAGFATDCETCHSAADSSWQLGRFDHSIYPLVGAHVASPCTACHGDGVFQGLPSDCVDCHLEDYQQAQDPDHAAAGFPLDCEVCHRGSDTDWSQTSFDHAIFELAGAHTTLDCNSCHGDGIYQGTPSACVDCHLDDYQQTEEPDHAAAGFATDCETCHDPTDVAWDQGRFDHAIYPLVGAHIASPCSTCHGDGIFEGLPSDCVDCHLEDYQAADDPDHVDAGFPTDCELCHGAADVAWDQATFDHATFQLVGAHSTLDCESCHGDGIYQGTPTACVDCHLDDYQGADEPDHVDAGFPTDCELCHQPADTSWDQGDFDHGVWPLVGAHVALDCGSCHSGGVFQGLPSDCVDCHLDDYQGADDPDHVDADFPTDCELCHQANDTDWDQGDFDHETFQLLGVHGTLDCDSCHSGGVYQGLPSDCVDCHLDDYQGADDPDHIAAGFPTDCELCHQANDTDWDQGDFDHFWFPIDSGDHRGFECSDCHPNPNVFAVFTCTTSCHPRSDMDDEHDDVDGYVYDSPACYSCHPDGQEPDFGMVRSHGSRRR